MPVNKRGVDKTHQKIECPCCGKDIIVIYKFEPFNAVEAFTVTQLEKNKEKIRDFVKASNVLPEKKAEFLEFINEEDTIFEDDQVDEVLKQYSLLYDNILL